MNERNWHLLENKIASCFIYETLCNSQSMYNKCLKLECVNIELCLHNTLGVLLKNEFVILTGSTAEGTDITSEDYVECIHSTTPGYISDIDLMHVLCDMQVIDEGDLLPQRFDDYMYCLAERGKHTTDGFRKLRIIHRPQYNSQRDEKWAPTINMSVKHGYLSSSKLLAITASASWHSIMNQSLTNVLSTKGPSQIIEKSGSANDLVKCFHVKTWPKEAESWFTRQTHWPDRKLKSEIMKIGYFLVPTGNSNSQESDLEWRCSFSIAEKILFQAMTKFQRCTFIMLKVLLKENLPADVNTDGEKLLLSSYHIKTLLLWCLEKSKLKWKPGDIIDIIVHLLDVLSEWIDQQFFPHYFIPSVNLLDSKQLHGRSNSLICIISAIRSDLSNKIMQLQFFMGQEITVDTKHMLFNIELMQDIRGRLLQTRMHCVVIDNVTILRPFKFSHSLLIQGLLRIQHDIHPQMHYLYRALYTDDIHDKLLKEVMPGLIDQYRGCIHLAKYCMAARDGLVLPGMLHTAESLLNNTVHLDPCSGYVKLACLFVATGDFEQAMGRLHAAEKKFLLMHKNMVTSALRNLQLNRWNISTEVYNAVIHEVFQKLVEGQVTADIIVTWPEYITVPDLLQFELIHESTQQVIVVPCNKPAKMVGSDCCLKWPPLSMIKLLKFVCAFNLGQFSTSQMENLVADLIASSLSVTVFPVNDICIIFNMAAWCYVKIKKYKPAASMMINAVETSSETEIMKQCAFSHQFLAYVLEQCLL